MNINVIFKDIGVEVDNQEVLDTALVKSLKKFHTRGFRIDNPEWIDENHSQIKIPVRLDEISELDNNLDKKGFDYKRNKAMDHVVEELVFYLNAIYNTEISFIRFFSKADGDLFPGTYDLKKIEFYLSEDNVSFNHIAELIVNSKGEYWTDNPDVVI